MLPFPSCQGLLDADLTGRVVEDETSASVRVGVRVPVTDFVASNTFFAASTLDRRGKLGASQSKGEKRTMADGPLSRSVVDGRCWFLGCRMMPSSGGSDSLLNKANLSAKLDSTFRPHQKLNSLLGLPPPRSALLPSSHITCHHQPVSSSRRPQT